MRMWIVILCTVLGLMFLGIIYLISRVRKFGFIDKICGTKTIGVVFSTCLVLACVSGIGLSLNLANSAVCVLYFAMIWILVEAVFKLIRWVIKLKKVNLSESRSKVYYPGVVALVCSVLALGYGWYKDHHVVKTVYDIHSQRFSGDPIRILMFADSHLGTTFDARGFSRLVDRMQEQNPDLLIIAGDFVDDGSSKEQMVEAIKRLAQVQTKYGIYFVFGNHDKGYYKNKRGFSKEELVEEFKKNKISVLEDESILIDQRFYLVGRKDYSVVKERGGSRKTVEELTKTFDQNKYVIVVDHQPVEYDQKAQSGVDLVLSGHTHGGQLFPFNRVGKWIGANDQIYGLEKRQHSQFIVTSGLSNWALKFKTGTKSEFVLINLEPEL